MRTRMLPAVTAALLLAANAALAAQTNAPPAAPNTPPAPEADAATALTGKTAPTFTLPDQNDKLRSLAQSRGKWIVLAFYPKDKTKG